MDLGGNVQLLINLNYLEIEKKKIHIEINDVEIVNRVLFYFEWKWQSFDFCIRAQKIYQINYYDI